MTHAILFIIQGQTLVTEHSAEGNYFILRIRVIADLVLSSIVYDNLVNKVNPQPQRGYLTIAWIRFLIYKMELIVVPTQ